MKRLLAHLISAVFLINCAVISIDAALGFYEDFDSVSQIEQLNDFTFNQAAGSYEIVEGALKITRGDLKYAYGCTVNFTPLTGKVVFEQRFKTQTKIMDYVNIPTIEDSNGNPIMHIMTYGGNLYVHNGSNKATTFANILTPDEWHTVMVVMDTDTKKYSMWFDGMLRASDFDYYIPETTPDAPNEAENVGRLQFASRVGADAVTYDMYFDYIKVEPYTSSIAALESSQYDVINTEGVEAVVVPSQGVDVDVFKANVIAKEGGSYQVYQSDGVTVKTGAILDGDIIKVTAQDGSTEKTYVIVVGTLPDFTTVINDNFDSPSGNSGLSGWQLTNAAFTKTELADDPNDSSNKVIQITKTGKESLNGAVRTFAPLSGIVYIGQDIYVGSMSTLSFMPIIKDSTGKELIKLMSMNGALFATNGNQNALSASGMDINKWYKCLFEIDTNRDVYSLYINGSRAVSERQFQDLTLCDDIARIDYMPAIDPALAEYGDFYIDNVKAYTLTPPSVKEISFVKPDGLIQKGENDIEKYIESINVHFDVSLDSSIKVNSFADAVILKNESNQNIEFEGLYNAIDNSYSLNLKQLLEYGKSYQLTVKAGITDSNGLAVQDDYTFSFQIEDNPLEIISFNQSMVTVKNNRPQDKTVVVMVAEQDGDVIKAVSSAKAAIPANESLDIPVMSDAQNTAGLKAYIYEYFDTIKDTDHSLVKSAKTTVNNGIKTIDIEVETIKKISGRQLTLIVTGKNHQIATAGQVYEKAIFAGQADTNSEGVAIFSVVFSDAAQSGDYDFAIVGGNTSQAFNGESFHFTSLSDLAPVVDQINASSTSAQIKEVIQNNHSQLGIDMEGFSTLSDHLKNELCSFLSGGGYADVQIFIEDFRTRLGNAQATASVISKLQEANYKEVYGILQLNATVIDIDFDDYSNLTDEAKDTVAKEMVKTSFTTGKSIKDKFQSLVDANISKTTTNNSPGPSLGGGGGVGGGGSVKTVVVTSPEIMQSTASPTKEDTSGSDVAKEKDFGDLEPTHWAKEAITKLTKSGIISGYEDNTFKPNENITREQFVKMIVIAFDLTDAAIAVPFTDVDKQEWYYEYVKIAYGANIINGIKEDKFGISEFITRQDLAVICYRLMQERTEAEKIDMSFLDAEQIPEYAKTAVAKMWSLGVINGFEDNTFKPGNLATRAEAAKILYKIWGGGLQ